MKRTVFIVVLLVLSIGIPVLAESNDSLSTELENPVLQKQELKLPWYKNVNYTLGYNGGLCWVGRDLNYYYDSISIYDYLFGEITRIVGEIYWLNSIEAGVSIPDKSRIIDVGLGYGMENIVGDLHFTCYNFRIGRLKKFYLYISYSDLKLNNIIPGLELNYSPVYGTEYNYDTTGVLETRNIRRDLIGGGIYLKFCNTNKNKKRSVFDPYLMIKIAGSHEIYNTSPNRDIRKKELNVWYAGIYEGFNLNITGRKETNYFHTNGRTKDSTEENLNPVLYQQEIKLPWYKKMNYTLGYNIGLCLRGSDLNSYPHGGLDIGGAFVGKFYLLNSIEAGVRIPIDNKIIETGLGYGWANINSGNFETRFPDTLVNNITVNSAELGIGNISKLYIYTGYKISSIAYGGLELDYCRGYGAEVYYPYVYPNSFVDARRDLLGGGCYIKISPTITLNGNLGINPYLMFKIGKVYEVHSTSPYSGLWDKKLTIWFTGLYGGFNFNIGGER